MSTGFPERKRDGGFNPSIPVNEQMQSTAQTVYKATKAVVAFVVPAAAAVGLLVKGLADGDLSLDEGLTFVGGIAAAVVTGGAVYRTENKPQD